MTETLNDTFENTDKSLIRSLYFQAFSIYPNDTCQSCMQDAYWELKVYLKNHTLMKKVNQYRFVEGFNSEIHIPKEYIHVTKSTLTDEVALRLKDHKEWGQYIEKNPEYQEPSKASKKTTNE